jgi:GntR family transcriptional regulator
MFSFQLNAHSGVPVYRQMIDQVQGALAAGRLKAGDQPPTIRQVAVDLAIRGLLETQQGTGTFIAEQPVATDSRARNRQMQQLAAEMIARAGANGFSLTELIDALKEHGNEQCTKRR